MGFFHTRGFFLFVWMELFFLLESFHLYGSYRRRTANFDLYSKLMAIEGWGFLRVLHFPWHGTSCICGLDTHTCCQEFGSGGVVTCFNYYGLSWPEMKPIPGLNRSEVVRRDYMRLNKAFSLLLSQASDSLTLIFILAITVVIQLIWVVALFSRQPTKGILFLQYT